MLQSVGFFYFRSGNVLSQHRGGVGPKDLRRKRKAAQSELFPLFMKFSTWMNLQTLLS
jgi:hypothetical protein